MCRTSGRWRLPERSQVVSEYNESCGRYGSAARPILSACLTVSRRMKSRPLFSKMRFSETTGLAGQRQAEPDEADRLLG